MLANLHICESIFSVDERLFRKLVNPRMAVAIQEAAIDDGGNMEKRKSEKRSTKKIDE